MALLAPISLLVPSSASSGHAVSIIDTAAVKGFKRSFLSFFVTLIVLDNATDGSQISRRLHVVQGSTSGWEPNKILDYRVSP